MQSVACKLMEDMMSTIGRLNDARSLMRRAHQVQLIEEGSIAQQFQGWHDAFNLVEIESDKVEFPEDVLSVSDLQKIETRIAFVELGIPPLAGEDLGAIEH